MFTEKEYKEMWRIGEIFIKEYREAVAIDNELDLGEFIEKFNNVDH